MQFNLFDYLCSDFDDTKTEYIDIDNLVDEIVKSRRCVVITGAGASEESGIPTFRDKDTGIWATHDINLCGTIEGFRNAPHCLWQLIIDFKCKYDPQPNNTHIGLSKLEKLGKVACIITQNFDHLHQVAGSKRVIEFHGSLEMAECINCTNKISLTSELFENEEFIKSLPLKCTQCNNYMKPSIILFGEATPTKKVHEAESEVENCDLLLVIGTSASVVPCSLLPVYAKRAGAKIIEINTKDTALTNSGVDCVLRQKSSVMSIVADKVEEKMKTMNQ